MSEWNEAIQKMQAAPTPDTQPREEAVRMPNPTPEMLASPQFEAIWNVIKSWDINVPEAYSGYCGANGSHVAMILKALPAAGGMDAVKVEIARLRPHYQSGSHLDHGRRQMLDHFEKLLASLSPAPTSGGEPKRPKVYHIGAALQCIADQHAEILSPREKEALYQASSKLWDNGALATPAPSPAGGDAVRKQIKRLRELANDETYKEAYRLGLLHAADAMGLAADIDAEDGPSPAGGVREAQIEAGARAIRQARVAGITPPDEGTDYDRKLAGACLRAALSPATAARGGEDEL